jgi:hypothetical protein
VIVVALFVVVVVVVAAVLHRPFVLAVQVVAVLPSFIVTIPMHSVFPTTKIALTPSK